jgi:iron complex transport system ATP-binding protein
VWGIGLALNSSAIELKNVGVIRRGNEILAGVNLTVDAGSCCAILGPNGSGKSALMAVLAGYLWPSTGTVRVDGRTYGRVNLGDVRRRIGLIEPSRMPKFDDRMCIRDVVATGLFGTILLPLHRDVTDSQRRRVDEEMASVGLGEIGERAYGALSSGEQMKTLLARAMVSNAKILLLDEPTVGLDIGSRAACVAVLDRLLARSRPPTVVIVSHHLDELPQAVDKIVLMKGGRMVGQGAPDDLLTSAHLTALFDCHVEVVKSNGRFLAGVRATDLG